MAYEKQGFKDGQKLTAAQLEKMENGIVEALENGSGIVDVNEETMMCDKTPQEIYELSLNADTPIYIRLQGGLFPVTLYNKGGDTVYGCSGSSTLTLGDGLLVFNFITVSEDKTASVTTVAVQGEIAE